MSAPIRREAKIGSLKAIINEGLGPSGRGVGRGAHVQARVHDPGMHHLVTSRSARSAAPRRRSRRRPDAGRARSRVDRSRRRDRRPSRRRPADRSGTRTPIVPAARTAAMANHSGAAKMASGGLGEREQLANLVARRRVGVGDQDVGLDRLLTTLAAPALVGLVGGGRPGVGAASHQRDRPAPDAAR